MLANRPEARMIAQALNGIPDRGQSAPSPLPRSWLGQPEGSFLKIG